MKKLRIAFALLHNMGLRNLLFRLKHELLRKTGLPAKQFPVNLLS